MEADNLRDGPTPEFLTHHDVTNRENGAGGKKIYSRLEQLLRADAITPEQCDAGRRLCDDRLIGLEARGRSCLDISVRGNNEDGTDSRHDAAHRYMAAVAALDGKASGPWRPSELILACVLHDQSFNAIGRNFGLAGAGIRDIGPHIARHLTVLADHYAKVDRANGRSTTPHTKEMALAPFEPKHDEEKRPKVA